MHTPRSLQVTTASDVLAREGGSILFVVLSVKGYRYPRVLALPPQDGAAAARAQVTAFLDACPIPLPIYVKLKDEGIEVRCADFGSYHEPYFGPRLFTEADPSHGWWRELHTLVHSREPIEDHFAGHFITRSRMLTDFLKIMCALSNIRQPSVCPSTRTPKSVIIHQRHLVFPRLYSTLRGYQGHCSLFSLGATA